MKNLLIPTFALLLLVFASCQKEGLETASGHGQTLSVVPDRNISARSAEVPFKANFNTTLASSGGENGIFTVDIIGVGNATHLGKSTQQSNSMLNATVIPWVQSGTQNAWTAANGDELFWSFSGTVNPPNEQGIITYSGSWDITGGSGRFKGVTGSGTYVGSASLVTNQGEITYDGSLKGL